MAVLETSELPGRASRMDWAFFLGSSAGTLEELRAAVREVMAGRVRGEMVGRRRAAPVVLCQPPHQLGQWHLACNYSPIADRARRDAILK